MNPLARILPLGGGMFLGWTLGANDAGNVFGTAVASGIIRFWSAAFLCAAFVIAGALLEGEAGIQTLSGITEQSISTAVLVSVAAALTTFGMTIAGLPVSTSQAVVGAILGIGMATGHTEYGGLIKVAICWVGTPLGAMIIAMALYKALAFLLNHAHIGMLMRDKLLWAGLILAGSYGAYALGANNAANTTGMFAGIIEGVSNRQLAFWGGISIALGVLTFSRRVIFSIGKGIMELDAFTAFVAVLAMSVTVHVFAMIGAPVSTSQGIVGAIIGIGLLRGVHVLHFEVLRNIAIGWVLTPVVSLILAAAGFAIFL